MEMPDLPQADDADMSAVFSAALAVLFSTHPDPVALLEKWESVASQFPLMLMKNGASDVKHNANVVLAQGLLNIARSRAADESR